MWYFKYLKNLLCIRVVAELFVLRVLLENQVYGLIFLDIMILIAEQIRAIKQQIGSILLKENVKYKSY